MRKQCSPVSDTGFNVDDVTIDTDACGRAVVAVTGEPATVGDPFLEFLAVLVPVTSDGITFHAYPDGHLDSMWAHCPGCGRQMQVRAVSGPGYDTGPYPAYRHLVRRRRQIPARSGLRRLVSRFVGCQCR